MERPAMCGGRLCAIVLGCQLNRIEFAEREYVGLAVEARLSDGGRDDVHAGASVVR